MFSTSGVMFIDNSRIDGRQFFGGRVCQLWQRTALAALPCQFLPSATPISVLLPLWQGQPLGHSWHQMVSSAWIVVGFSHTGSCCMVARRLRH
jgi:hypothetical protein